MYQVKYIDKIFIINELNDNIIVRRDINHTLPCNKFFHNDILDNNNHIISSPVRENIIVGYLTPTVLGYKGNGKQRKRIYKTVSLNHKLPNFRVAYKLPITKKKLIVFKFINWKEKLPTGTIVTILGDMTEENIVKAYTYFFKLDHKVIKNLEPKFNIKEATIARVKDDNLYSISIDPKGSKDIDDAISMDDNFLYVHIAQPIVFLSSDDILEISEKRFSTLYRPDKEISLFGDKITIAASLTAGKIKKCYTLKFNQEGIMVEHYPGTVCLNKNLSYDFVNNNIHQFHKLFEFSVNVFGEINSAQKLVENWMIHSNCCIGNILETTIYRKNDTDKKLLNNLNLESRKYFYDSSEYVYGENSVHTILNKTNYLHFTSPIRRMVDNFIHYELTYKTQLFKGKDLEKFINNINRLSKLSSKFHRTIQLRSKIREITNFNDQGIVVGIFDNYINILIPNLGIFRHYIVTRYGTIIDKKLLKLNQKINLKLGLIMDIFPHNMLLITTELDNYLI